MLSLDEVGSETQESCSPHPIPFQALGNGVLCERMAEQPRTEEVYCSG